SSRALCVRDKSRAAGDPLKRAPTPGSAGSHDGLSGSHGSPVSSTRASSAPAPRVLPPTAVGAVGLPPRQPRTVARVIDPQWWPLALAALAVLAGAVSVRTTGMGFALLSSPFLVMALGPVEGILVTNVCGIVAALLNLTVVRADLDWSRAAKVV